MDYKRINNLTGWGVFLIALVVYLLTMAPTASYWDCGEFIACSNELEAPHPPGAPFFLLVGRIFAMMAFGNVELIAFMVNLLSVLSSAFTVLFTFWITTYLARRLAVKGNEQPSQAQTFAIMAAGVVAGLTNTFADSFWFNAVEAEVYAMSSFFTAIVVWLMLKWEARADEPGNERWIVLIAYLMGLSIGVHLLNLLAIPALAFIYYFRKYEFSWSGFFITSGIAVAILGIIQTGIILYTFDLAWGFEKAFVGVANKAGSPISGMGLPIGSGLIFFFLLLFGGLVYGVYWSAKNKKLLVNVSLLSVIMIYLGISSYLMIPIRSQANPPIDENNPENTQTFLSYMKREQYGNRPLFKGPLYNKQPVGYEEDGKEYVLREGDKRYTEYGDKIKPRYAPKDLKVFPRMYESGRYKMGVHGYVNYVRRTGDPNTPYDDKPTAGEDMRFFLNYQIIHMYWRYFMWNFSGKEGDTQDMGWESGLNFSKTSAMPEIVKSNPAKNHYFMLPFLLGLLGLFWQANKNGKDAAVVGLLFFFTGIAIVIYLNQYPQQPRERDYSFAGSFQTYAIWVGLSVIALYQMLEKYLKGSAQYAAAAIAIIAPLLMGFQNWDDHSRAGRYVAPDSARNLLESLAPNAVLFTNGDNDTFPLWYLQEVEKVREDVRVLCLSYVNTDWYIDQMYMKMNQSEPLPLSLKKDDYVGQAKQSRRMGNKAQEVIRLKANAQELVDKGIIYPEDVPYVQENMTWTYNTRGGQSKYLELKDVLITNLLQNVAAQGWERPVYFANTVTPSNMLNLDGYLRQEGLAYRVLPVRKPVIQDRYDNFKGNIDIRRMKENMLTKFRFRNLDKEGMFYDENVIRMVSNYHNTFYRLGAAYLRESDQAEADVNRLKSQMTVERANTDSLQVLVTAREGDATQAKANALEVIDFAMAKFPYDVATPDPYLILRHAMLYDRLGEKEKADQILNDTQNMITDQVKYYHDTQSQFLKKQYFIQTLNFLRQYYRDPAYARQDKATELEEFVKTVPRFFQ
ncbi:MAG: DUF2723 domain-containing protein [Bacteroidota bacterium]